MHINNCATMPEFTPDAGVVVASFINEDGQQVGHQGGHLPPSSLRSVVLYQCSQYLYTSVTAGQATGETRLVLHVPSSS